MFKSEKLKKSQARALQIRLGIAAFVLGIGVGYSITDNTSASAQIAALGDRVKHVLFMKATESNKNG